MHDAKHAAVRAVPWDRVDIHRAGEDDDNIVMVVLEQVESADGRARSYAASGRTRPVPSTLCQSAARRGHCEVPPWLVEYKLNVSIGRASEVRMLT